ncbi:hypothetical protein FQN53_001714 [Emmonsiellopsis sp. PD_33]|nr:hypothetical protein FQN53_001714 [Emmonsiellopsis sp. PD_33]KAK2786609.1 hypothetical protein FQN51_003497 [Onygenales sp. PD_10]
MSENTPTTVQETPQISEKHEKMLKTLTAKISTLQSDISKTEALLRDAREKLNTSSSSHSHSQSQSTPATNKTPSPLPPKDATAIVQRHIRLLHEYNEIKDVGQGLMGLIAEARGVRYVDVQKGFGIAERD